MQLPRHGRDLGSRMLPLKSGFHLRIESNSRYFRFAFLRLVIGFKISCHFSYPIRSKTKTNRDWLIVKGFPTFRVAACICFKF